MTEANPDGGEMNKDDGDGDGDGTGYYSSWALQDPKTKNYNIWYTNRWHHVCIAYDAKRSHIAVIKVSILSI